MEKKVVIITGCVGGIGTALCKKFKDKGWYVVGTDINSSYDEKLVDKFFCIDLTNPVYIEPMIESIKLERKRLDCIVNNAAYQVCKPLIDTSVEEFKKTIACNMVAPFLLGKYGFGLLKETNGNIVNIGSVHSIITSDQIAAYGCSKAGLVGLTRNMAIEFSKYGIRVNSVSPGPIDTMMLRDGLKRGHVSGLNVHGIDDLVNNLGKRCPLDKVGQPIDVAELTYFLANNKKAANITGTNMFTDGGTTIKLSIE